MPSFQKVKITSLRGFWTDEESHFASCSLTRISASRTEITRYNQSLKFRNDSDEDFPSNRLAKNSPERFLHLFLISTTTTLQGFFSGISFSRKYYYMLMLILVLFKLHGRSCSIGFSAFHQNGIFPEAFWSRLSVPLLPQ